MNTAPTSGGGSEPNDTGGGDSSSDDSSSDASSGRSRPDAGRTTPESAGTSSSGGSESSSGGSSSEGSSDIPDDVDRIDPGAPSGGSSSSGGSSNGGSDRDGSPDYGGGTGLRDDTMDTGAQGGSDSGSGDPQTVEGDPADDPASSGGGTGLRDDTMDTGAQGGSDFESDGPRIVDGSPPDEPDTGGGTGLTDATQDTGAREEPPQSGRPGLRDDTMDTGARGGPRTEDPTSLPPREQNPPTTPDGPFGGDSGVEPTRPDPASDDEILAAIREDVAAETDYAPSQYAVTEFDERDGTVTPIVELRGQSDGGVSNVPDEYRNQFREDAATSNQWASVDEVAVVDTDDGIGVAFGESVGEREQRFRAAAQFDDDFSGVDITTADVESTSDGMVRLDEETQTEIATMRIVEDSDQVGPDGRFGEGDLEFDFEGGELVDVSLSSDAQMQAADSVSREDEIGAAGDGLDLTTSEFATGPDGNRLRSTSAAAQDDGFTFLEGGDDWPTNRGEAVSVGVDLLTGDGADLIDTDAPTNQREVSRAIISARRERLGLDIDPISAGDAADSAVDRATNLGREEGALVAAGLGVVVPEPSTTTAGGAILIGAAGAAVASAGSEIDVGRPNQEVSEVEVGEPAVSEMEVADPDVAELDVGEFAPDASEMQVGDPTRTDGEVDVPSVEAQQVVTGSEFLEETDERDAGVYGDEPITIGEEDLEDTGPLVDIPEDEQQRQIREELERRQEFVREDTTYDQVERDFPTGGDAVVDGSVGSGVGEDVGTPEVEAGFELDEPTDTSVSAGTGGLGDDGVGVGPDTWSGLEEVTDVAVDTSVENVPATAPMSEVYSASPAQAFATPSPQGFGYDPLAGNAYPNPTTQPSRTRQGRGPSRPPLPGFESAPEQPGPASSSPVDIQITNPVATATDVLGVGSGVEMADSSPDAMPAEDDFEDEWPSDAGFGGFEGWGGGDAGFGGFDGAGFGGASFDGADDMWDPDNWENDQGGQGGLFGGF